MLNGALMAELRAENRGRRPLLAGLPQDFLVGRPLPLNSQRLTVALIKRIATALKLLVVGSKEDLPATIEGKLDLSRHEHQNVQVVVMVGGESEQALLQLVGAEGHFLQIALPGAEESQASDAKRGIIKRAETEGELCEGDEGRDIAVILEHARKENRLLQEKVSNAKDELVKTSERVKSLWKANCSLAREFDEMIFAKDEEIAELKCLLASRPSDVPSEHWQCLSCCVMNS